MLGDDKSWPWAILNYCSGNKLSYLNGEILAQLPQLHSLQLAGSNPWICDCHLRKLVRQLLGNSNTTGAQLNANPSKQKASILQDEPRCLGTVGGGADDDADGTGRQQFSQLPDSSGVSSSPSLAAVGPSPESSSSSSRPSPWTTSKSGKRRRQQMEKKEPADSRWSSSFLSWTNMSKYNQRPKLQLAPLRLRCGCCCCCCCRSSAGFARKQRAPPLIIMLALGSLSGLK